MWSFFCFCIFVTHFDIYCMVYYIYFDFYSMVYYTYLLQSSLCCMSDKTNYAYQLFGVYQQYPDAVLRSTMAKIRSDQMVSLRRPYARTKLKSGQFLPVSNCPYQLSIRCVSRGIACYFQVMSAYLLHLLLFI